MSNHCLYKKYSNDFTKEDIEKLFGKKVAKIIDGLTKIQDVFDKNVSMFNPIRSMINL